MGSIVLSSAGPAAFGGLVTSIEHLLWTRHCPNNLISISLFNLPNNLRSGYTFIDEVNTDRVSNSFKITQLVSESLPPKHNPWPAQGTTPSRNTTLFESLTMPGTFMYIQWILNTPYEAATAITVPFLQKWKLRLWEVNQITPGLDGKPWNKEYSCAAGLSSSCLLTSLTLMCFTHSQLPWECSHLLDPPGASAPVLGGACPHLV